MFPAPFATTRGRMAKRAVNFPAASIGGKPAPKKQRARPRRPAVSNFSAVLCIIFPMRFRRILAAAALALSLPALWGAKHRAKGKIDALSLGMFNERLTDEDRRVVESGGVLLRSVSSMKKLCAAETEETMRVIGPMRNGVKSGYIAEIVNVRPYKGNEDLIERINAAMGDFLSFTEIKFRSEKDGNLYPLYRSAELLSSEERDGVLTIEERLTMDMLGTFRSRITVESRGTHFIYTLENLDKIKYKRIFTVCSPGELRSVVEVFRKGDWWVVYAVGGADAIRPPFFGSLIEPEFICRVRAFADFVFSAIDSEGRKVESSLDRRDAVTE